MDRQRRWNRLRLGHDERADCGMGRQTTEESGEMNAVKSLHRGISRGTPAPSAVYLIGSNPKECRSLLLSHPH